MKYIILIFFVLILNSSSFGQDFISALQFQRTFNLKKDSVTGTCFYIIHNNHNYWVTAKHVLGNVKNNQKIAFYILKDSSWLYANGTVLLHTNPAIDVAVIVPDDTLTVYALKLDQVEITLGDEGFFMGFPFGLKTKDQGNINKGFPFALVKKCTFSGNYFENGIQMFFLDGNNNPGFSGGPVFFKNRSNPSDKTLYLIGTISSYVNQKNQMVTPLGTFDYNENSGIILVFGSSHIKEILTQNGK